MKVKLENREYDLKANGAFMKKYQEQFNENMIQALYKAIQEKDIFTCSKLTYCAIEEEMSFEEWIDSFETPLFIIGEMDRILDFLIRGCQPTVPAEDSKSENGSKKKTTNN